MAALLRVLRRPAEVLGEEEGQVSPWGLERFGIEASQDQVGLDRGVERVDKADEGIDAADTIIERGSLTCAHE